MTNHAGCHGNVFPRPAGSRGAALSFARQSLQTFVSRVLVTLINIPISMIVARRLGAEGQGAYSAMMALTSLWATSFLLGLDSAHTYALAGRRATLQQVVTHGIVWSIALGLVATPLYLLVTPVVATDPNGLLRSVLILSAAAVPLTLGRFFILAIFLGEGRVDRFNLLNVGSNVVLLALLVIFLIVLPGGVREAAGAYVVSLLVFFFLGGIWIAGRFREVGKFHWSFDRSFARSSLIYGLKGHFGSLVLQMTYRLDQLLITRMLGLEAQGLYSVAVILAEKLSHISASAQLVLFPRISSMSVDSANELTPRVCRLTFYTVLIVAAGLFVLGPWVIHLFYGPDFDGSFRSLRILLPGVAALSVGRILSGDLSGRDRRVGPTVALTIAFLVNLVLNLIWIPRLGIEGAAWASNVAYVVQSAALALIFRRVTGIPLRELLLPRPSDLQPIWNRLKRRA